MPPRLTDHTHTHTQLRDATGDRVRRVRAVTRASSYVRPTVPFERRSAGGEGSRRFVARSSQIPLRFPFWAPSPNPLSPSTTWPQGTGKAPPLGFQGNGASIRTRWLRRQRYANQRCFTPKLTRSASGATHRTRLPSPLVLSVPINYYTPFPRCPLRAARKASFRIDTRSEILPHPPKKKNENSARIEGDTTGCRFVPRSCVHAGLTAQLPREFRSLYLRERSTNTGG